MRMKCAKGSQNPIISPSESGFYYLKTWENWMTWKNEDW